FYAIHVDKQALNTEAKIVDWAVKQGLDKAKFQEAYNSFSVAGKVKRATLLQEAYKVEGVPAIGIAGRYYTDGTRSGSMGRALQTTDALVAEARKAR
ncbi:MAG: DsbA family protein, partial [Burkholderiaceae bacterium]|nr:DsbA family protein [Burkholderiaceae bacterium]